MDIEKNIANKVVSIDAIKPHKRNYRQHPESQISQLGASHSRFGQFRSCVLWERPNGEYITVAGHGIIEAMKRNGVTSIRAFHSLDRKSTRLNSSHANISYAVFCLKKKN